MLKNSFFKIIPFLLFIVLFYSCDKEFSVVGEDIVGDNTFGITKEEFPVVAYNEKIEVVQSNNLETNALGVYKNPSFGTTSATFVTQLTMASVNPTFAETAKIKSVVLSIPYFSTKTELKDDGSSTYVLDSIYGSPEKAKMKLSVYESGYYMRDLDPEEQLTQPQKYYNDQYSDFYQKIIGTALNNSSKTAENSEFFFDPSEHSVTTTVDSKETITRSVPAMQLSLDTTFFTSKILGAPAGSLADNNVFKDYFRGLFFNIETIDGNSGNLAMINFKKGTITITYTEDGTTDKTFVLNLTGSSTVTCNTVNFLDQSNVDQKYVDATKPASDIIKTEGVSNLYLKGGEGSMAILQLFDPTDNHGLKLTDPSNGVPDQLDDMRRNKYLVNQADLTMYLNTTEMKTSSIPQRVYLYDYTNSLVLADYNETSVVSSNSKYNKYVFGGILSKDKNGAYFYKFRITNHLRNLVNSTDYDNVKLGLVVTEDINKYAFYALKDKAGIPLYIPVASVMNPLGAIVFGNNIPSDDVNYAKKLKFEIYYTKAN